MSICIYQKKSLCAEKTSGAMFGAVKVSPIDVISTNQLSRVKNLR